MQDRIEFDQFEMETAEVDGLFLGFNRGGNYAEDEDKY